ncbi:MAG: hypothetical protein ACPHN2_00245 [Sinimarinibacterium flocculans]|uniref:hypothetical protein n=1 Tax=Sinimarinibacterium flocculans TaxID=985250 RepID=UPI003C489DC0
MAHQGIPPQHRDPRRTASHRLPRDPASRPGASHLAEEADDYATGSADDYNLDEETYGGGEHTAAERGRNHDHGPSSRHPGGKPERTRS